jgi:hypothetical protein
MLLTLQLNMQCPLKSQDLNFGGRATKLMDVHTQMTYIEV